MITTEHRVKKGKREVCIGTARDEKGGAYRIETWGDPPYSDALKNKIGKIAEDTVRRSANIKQ